MVQCYVNKMCGYCCLKLNIVQVCNFVSPALAGKKQGSLCPLLVPVVGSLL